MKSLRWTDYARSAVANKKLSKLRISVWPNCRRQCFISVLPKRSFAFRRKLKLISFSLSYTFAATRTKVASNLRIYVMVLCVAEMCVLFLNGGTHSQFTTNPITQKHGGVGRLNAHIRINTTKTLYGKGKQCAALLIFIFCRRPFIVVCLHCCCHSFIFITVNIIFFLARCTLRPSISLGRKIVCVSSTLVLFIRPCDRTWRYYD